MKGYELVYVFNPNTTEEQRNAFDTKLHELVKSKGGQVVKTESWGKRKLAYPVKKVDYGVYQLLYYTPGTGLNTEMDTQFRHSEDILLWQAVKVEDVTLEHEKFIALKEKGSMALDISER